MSDTTLLAVHQSTPDLTAGSIVLVDSKPSEEHMPYNRRR
ncbi:unnamed protein product [Commensalibacter papalotli (ex Botero et al. 2024)]|uniref:Uncharacterized protein n=1 Tax=Commensalibacter papalotli (ex Botero et al. 2024) TaxID=2972766 RepID=A0ABM9HLJ5_9PROT|nr:unnamed protein product [Commensalibacter papalotli (ex Botero et al. 2024)]CAI3950439.1 unnamed protein product [Commensalibacter papalotli (ex Botero et al. 2024)]